MAAAPQNQALEVIKKRIKQVEERYDGYQTDLTESLYDILSLVSDPPHNISQEISRRVSALGEKLVQNKGDIS